MYSIIIRAADILQYSGNKQLCKSSIKSLLNYPLAEMSNQRMFSSIGLVTLSWQTLDQLPG